MCPKSPDGPSFTRTRNSDGTFTSLCNRCPLTIARAGDARDLPELESRHICQPVERRQVVQIVHRTYTPPTRSSKRLTDSNQNILHGSCSSLSQSAKLELIRAHLFLHPCCRCEKSAQHLSPDDERVCFSCQFSLKRRWKELAWAAPLLPKVGESSRCHEVQLYSSEELFLHRFTRFIGAALRAGDAVVVVVTQSHRDGLFQRLLADGLDVTAAVDQGRYIPLDVADTLATFMVNDFPDPVRFWKITSALLAEAKNAARGKQPHVAACGECAPLLLQGGMAHAAVRLEGLWDEIAKSMGVDILCGYPGESFRGEQGTDTLQRVLAEHSAVHAR
jgi:DcmR-like sensory protein